MKKLLAVLLAAVMLFSLTACEKEEDSEPSVLGTWEGSVDIAPILAEALQMQIEEAFPVRITYTFGANDRYTQTINVEDVVDVLSGMVDLALDKLAEAVEPYGFTVEEALALQGMTVEDFREQILATPELEAWLMMLAPDHTAYYKYESGKLYFAETKKAFDAQDFTACNYVTLNGNEMWITDVEADGKKYSETVPGWIPAVLTRRQDPPQ